MFRLLPCGPEPSGTPQALERPQGNWNHLERLERSSPLRGVRGVWNSPQGYWNVRSTIVTPGTVLPFKGSQRGLELPAGHNLLSAEREVDAGNR